MNLVKVIITEKICCLDRNFVYRRFYCITYCIVHYHCIIFCYYIMFMDFWIFFWNFFVFPQIQFSSKESRTTFMNIVLVSLLSNLNWYLPRELFNDQFAYLTYSYPNSHELLHWKNRSSFFWRQFAVLLDMFGKTERPFWLFLGISCGKKMLTLIDHYIGSVLRSCVSSYTLHFSCSVLVILAHSLNPLTTEVFN